ncbi:outer membrane beta-barrel protein [Helicobacter cetorum]|uniref:outer membrane beta-barrel protein n=1 Tax=Helicobacter cetorum TaxID=138563 RepID=UPI000CF0E53C|nr:outer membrane beta-barrel protein [Helicobacter cetorum]
MRIVVFLCALFLGFLDAHQKDGFFIEGGFETGMLEHAETHTKVSMPCNEALCINQGYYLSHSSEILKPNQNATGVTFSTRNIIQTSIQGNSLKITSFLPYNLSNVSLVMHVNGKDITITHLQELPQFSQATFDLNLFPILKPYENDKNISFTIEPSIYSSMDTTRVLNAVNAIKVNIIGTFSNEPTGDTYPVQETKNGKKVSVNVSDYVPITGALARDYIYVLLNISYLFGSNAWKVALENAPFAFVNAERPFDPQNCAKDRADFNTCNTNADPNIYGQAPAWCAEPNSQGCHIWTPKQVWENFTNQCGYNTNSSASFNDCLNIQGSLKDDNSTDFGSVKLKLGVINSNANVYGRGWFGSLGLDEDFINPNNKIWHTWDWQNSFPLYDIFHEYGHTRGYSHNGDMTYPNNKTMYDICEGANHTDCYKVHAGYAGLSEEVLMQLAKENKLPINYNTLNLQATPNYGAKLPPNMQKNPSFEYRLPKLLQVSSSNHSNAIVGADVKLGYQQYLNDFFGFSYYGIFKYNYTNAKGDINTINQYGYGVGADLLIDFLNSYAPNRHHNIGNFISSLGTFVGLRVFYNRYKLIDEVKNRGNLNAVFGFNYRYGHSKYSLGASLPLVQDSMKVDFQTPSYSSVVSFEMGVSHFNLFLNYGWVF